jgi:hypothetical protein
MARGADPAGHGGWENSSVEQGCPSLGSWSQGVLDNPPALQVAWQARPEAGGCVFHLGHLLALPESIFSYTPENGASGPGVGARPPGYWTQESLSSTSVPGPQILPSVAGLSFERR